MSVCDDERWKVGQWQEGYVHECPCHSNERSVYFCGLCVFEPHDEYDIRTSQHQDNRPDSCPHAAALRAVVENPELVLVAAEHDFWHCRHGFRDLNNNGKLARFCYERKVEIFETDCPCDKWEIGP